MSEIRKTYNGVRSTGRKLIWIAERRTDGGEILRDLPHYPMHSPEGFEWGGNISGAADLALAILIDHLDERPTREDLWNCRSVAWSLHQQFKREFIIQFRSEWTITAEAIQDWLERRDILDHIREYEIWAITLQTELAERLQL